MVVNPYIPDRGDIIKLEFGSAKQVTSDLIRRALALRTSGTSLEVIAEFLNNELEQQGREQIGYRPVLVMSPFAYNRMASLVLAFPITSQKKGLNFEVPLLDNMKTNGVVLSDHIKALDWRGRKAIFVEKAPEILVEEVQAKIETLIL